MKLLHIDAGITGDNSVSRQLTAAIVQAAREANPALQVVRRDLAAQPVPHLDGGRLGGLAENEILQEFLGADFIVIGAPMYNFGVPSQLKSWLDHVLVAGKTFRYGANGPEGLAGGKRVIVASARGGVFTEGSPMAAIDFQEPYLRAVFNFIGVTDVEVVRAEGVAISPENREAALKAAIASAPEVAATLAALAA
jgi:FMN-dependent NADH-azoreductase